MATRKPIVLAAGQMQQLQAADVLDPVSLPVMVAAGASHAQGAAGDPGATASTCKVWSDGAAFVTPCWKNFLVNGDFSKAQRQAPATYTTIANDKYGPDRWRLCSQSASLQYQRQTGGGAGFNAYSYGQIKQITNAGKFLMCQPMEASTSRPLVQYGPVTLICKLLAVGTISTIRLGMIYLTFSGTADTIPANVVTTWGANSTDPTLGTNLAYSAPTSIPAGQSGAAAAGASSISGNAVSCTAGGGVQTFAATFNVPATAKNLIPAIWSDTQMAVNDLVQVAEFQLVPDAAVRPWLVQDPAADLMECQRFYSKTYPVDTASGTASIDGNPSGIAVSTDRIYPAQVFPVLMRRTPNCSVYSYNGTSGRVSTAAAVDAGTASTQVFALSSRGYRQIYDATAPFTTNAGYMWHSTHEAEL